MKLSAFAFLFASLRLLAQTTSTDRPTIPTLPDVNPQLLQLVIEDQWDRGNDMFGNRQIKAPVANWEQIGERDEQRHARVREFIKNGQLRSGKDFAYAALIFQHSGKADDLMFGHVLAMTAVAKNGDAMAKWLAAATLDRYLWTLGQPQLFGTQFQGGEGKVWTMGSYNDRALLDSERALWCVVPFAEQQRILKQVQGGGPIETTQIRDCR